MILYQLYTIMWIVYGLIPPPSRSKNQALSPPTPQKPKVTLSPCRGLCYCQGLDLHSYTLWVGMENAELESSNPPRISKKNGRSGIRRRRHLSYTLWVGIGEWTKCRHVEWGVRVYVGSIFAYLTRRPPNRLRIEPSAHGGSVVSNHRGRHHNF